MSSRSIPCCSAGLGLHQRTRCLWGWHGAAGCCSHRSDALCQGTALSPGWHPRESRTTGVLTQFSPANYTLPSNSPCCQQDHEKLLISIFAGLSCKHRFGSQRRSGTILPCTAQIHQSQQRVLIQAGMSLSWPFNFLGHQLRDLKLTASGSHFPMNTSPICGLKTHARASPGLEFLLKCSWHLPPFSTRFSWQSNVFLSFFSMFLLGGSKLWAGT